MVLISEQQINVSVSVNTAYLKIGKKTYRGLDLMKIVMEWNKKSENCSIYSLVWDT